jgi:chromosomal replication initiation ATPase DnaA
VWQQCLDQLHARLDARQVQLWLNPLVPVDLCTDPASLTLLCSSRFKLDSIKTNYLAHMNEALRSHLDAPSASCLLVTTFNKR